MHGTYLPNIEESSKGLAASEDITGPNRNTDEREIKLKGLKGIRRLPNTDHSTIPVNSLVESHILIRSY